MDKEKLTPWIEKLNAESDGKKRNGIVAEMCKEHGLKIGDAWKLLKEAGYGSPAPNNSQDKPETDPQNNQQAEPETDPANNQQAEPKAEEKKLPAVLRHKTEYPRYRCAGLVLTQKPETYQVTESQLEKLKRDPWVEIVDNKEAKAE
jgi:hypothetical protein